MKITSLYQVSHYIRVKKTKKYKELGPAKLPRYKRILYIRPRYNEVLLYQTLIIIHEFSKELLKMKNNKSFFLHLVVSGQTCPVFVVFFLTIYADRNLNRCLLEANVWVKLSFINHSKMKLVCLGANA